MRSAHSHAAPLISTLRHRSHELFQTAFKQIPAALALSDIESSLFLDANAFFLDLTGYSTEELIGHSSIELQLWPDINERNRVAKELKTNGYIRSAEVSMRRRDGQILFILASFEMVEIEGRKCVLGMATDITERKANESRLEAALKAADHANRAKSEFLANISHDMRTPLTAIKGFADLLEGYFPDDREESQYLRRLRSNVLLLSQIIDDTLHLSGIESGKLKPNLSLMDLPRVAHTIISSFEPLTIQKGIALGVRWEGSPPAYIHTDEKMFHQILNNLIGNAVKFTTIGRVEVTFETFCNQLRVLVTDTGPGIDPKDHERIFEPFSQANGSKRNPHDGTGLGLTLARKMAQSLGGDVVLVRSGLGKGAIFAAIFADLPR